MEKKEYAKLHETLYQETLPNGLQVTLLPKNDFHKIYGLFTTNYGSIDNEFVPLGANEFVHVPDGVAHFLEHKMFEKETGDVFQIFGKQGASANAFTSFTRTSYLFSSTNHVNENLQTLLDFVQQPYFTEATVTKEKGIIAQEIQMYQDDPNWRLFFGILGNLYPQHPLSIDIAGTVESINQITAQDLYTCYHTFYHPSNMNLFVVGDISPMQIMELISNNQASKSFAPYQEIRRRFSGDTRKIRTKSQISMEINRPKTLVGIKGADTLPERGIDLLRYQIAANLLFQMLFGNTSRNYLRLYDQGLLDDSFGYEFNLDREFHFADFGGDTSDPDRLAGELIDILLSAEKSSEITERNLELLKKKMIGKHLQALNSLEYIANQFSQMQFGSVTLFDRMEIIENIQLSDCLSVAKQLIHSEAISRFTLLPNIKE